MLLFKGYLGLIVRVLPGRKWVQVSCKGCELDFQTQRFFFVLLLLESYIFNFLTFLKYIYKNLLHSRGPCLLSSVTKVMLFHCFSSSTVVCFAFSSVNMSFFHLCHFVCNVSSYFFLLASILAGPRNPIVFRLVSETALKAQVPY